MASGTWYPGRAAMSAVYGHDEELGHGPPPNRQALRAFRCAEGTMQTSPSH